MEIRHRLALVCATCGHPSDEHDDNCPRYLIEKMLENEPTYHCGMAGCSGEVQVAPDDFLRCRWCKARFSIGTFADVEDPKRVFLHRVRPDEEWVEAYVLGARGKGRGVFKIDVKVSAMREQEKVWMARWRAAKAATKAAKAAERHQRLARKLALNTERAARSKPEGSE